MIAWTNFDVYHILDGKDKHVGVLRLQKARLTIKDGAGGWKYSEEYDKNFDPCGNNDSGRRGGR